MTNALDSALWSAGRAEQALHDLALAAGLAPHAPARPLQSIAAPGDELEDLLQSFATELDLELEPIGSPYPQLNAFLAGAGPALLAIEAGTGGLRLAALLGSRGRRAVLLAPDGARVEIDRALLRERWCAGVERDLGAALEPVLDAAGVRTARRAAARAALLAEHLAMQPVGGAWLVRLPPGRPLLAQARRARLPRKVAAIVLASSAASALGLAAWIALGRGVFEGGFEIAWVVAWILCLVTAMPLRWLEGFLQADVALRLGALLKRRLLCGAARLDPEEVRGEGSGSLLGRVLESEALESVALAGGFLFLGAAIDVGIATFALAHAPHAAAGLALLALWTAVALALGLRQIACARAFAVARQALTEDTVERMVGHRTRIVQEPPELWHVEEDRRLAEYVERSRQLDRTTLWLSACCASGFGLTGLAVLGWAYVAGASAPAALAIGVGSILLGQQALSKLSGGLAQLAVCVAAWRRVRPLYRAAARAEEPGLPRAVLRRVSARGAARPPHPAAGEGAALGAATRTSAPLISARGVDFRHSDRAAPALAGVEVSVGAGERVLVEGPSGGGKSTLAAILGGWRTPGAGTVLLGGLDRRTLGAAGWRARVAAAPQFHENRVFTGTLAFNLLLGAPARNRGEGDVQDEEAAAAVCRELGLGDLLERMPSGLHQLVGETGWQLSHGERGRIFVARALLSGADLLVLDESLAGLDPHTARGVLDSLMRRPSALIVMAHP